MKSATMSTARALLSAALCLVAGQSLVAGVFPGDGRKLTVYGIDRSLGDGALGGTVCDLTDAVILGRHEMVFEKCPATETSGHQPGYTLRLYDAAGRSWYEGANETRIPVTGLYPGTYILEIATDGASQTFKVMIR